MRRRVRALVLVPLATVFGSHTAGAATLQSWRATDGIASVALDRDQLHALGLDVSETRATASVPVTPELPLPASTVAFAARGFDVGFRTIDDAFAGFESESVVLPVQGGLALEGTGVEPVFLFDFSLELARRHDGNWLLFRPIPSLPAAPFAVRVPGFAFDGASRELVVRIADVVVTAGWARRIGKPELEGTRVGAFDLRLRATLDYTDGIAPEEPVKGAGGSVLDVLLGELYGLGSHSRSGTYPTGRSGLAAATTSCNNGNVDVDWKIGFAPLLENHPFIGLGMFRLKDGILEMIGQNWLKHGWYALSNDQCNLGCPQPGSGTFLAIGCSDTYSASNNAEPYYLGPREEVNPHTGEWTAIGSHFDASPIDGDRDFYGSVPDTTAIQLQVADVDLGNLNVDSSPARYFYEGCYFVAGDDVLANNLGWREVSTTWGGSSWSFPHVPSSQGTWRPEPGPVVLTWGDQHDTRTVAPDDGLAILAVKTIDLGGGLWHYEYALYNRTSGRGFHSFSVPTGAANVTNVGFHDLDQDAANDWSSEVDGGAVTWSTDDWVSNPNAPALTYQTMFNFRFDADQPPVTAPAEARLFAPGTGTAVPFDTRTPSTSTSVVAGLSGSDFDVTAEPNPFDGATSVRFSVPRSGPVRLTVLDVTGRAVRTLVDGPAPAGDNAVRWNGRDDEGSRVASGVYFFRLESDRRVRTVKGTLLH